MGSSHAPRAAHAIEEHVGELAVRLEAPTLAELFEEAGRALSEAMRQGGATAAPEVEENVTVTAPDRDALLVEWLNELIFRAEVGHVLFTSFHVTRASDRQLEATVRGIPLEGAWNPVKAATFHGLSIADRPGWLTATVVLDV